MSMDRTSLYRLMGYQLQGVDTAASRKYQRLTAATDQSRAHDSPANVAKREFENAFQRNPAALEAQCAAEEEAAKVDNG